MLALETFPLRWFSLVFPDSTTSPAKPGALGRAGVGRARPTALRLPNTKDAVVMVSTELGACEWFVWDLRRSNLLDRGQLDQVVGEFLQSNPRGAPPAS